MTIQEAYSRHLKNKRVALVGGADNFSYSELFERDIVVTVNDHCIRQKIKPDVIYHVIRGPDLWNALIRLLDTPPKFFWGSIRDDPYERGISDYRDVDEFVNEWHRPPEQWVGHFAAGEWDGPNPYGEEYEWLNQIHHKYDCKLLTGLVGLADIMRYEPEEIFVCGMDLYLDNLRGRPGYRDSHRIQGNIDFINDARDDGRVTLDTPLVKSLDEYRRRVNE